MSKRIVNGCRRKASILLCFWKTSGVRVHWEGSIHRPFVPRVLQFLVFLLNARSETLSICGLMICALAVCIADCKTDCVAGPWGVLFRK